MDVKNVMLSVLQTDAAVEIINEIVWNALQSSRDTCAEMLEQIEAKRDRKGLWSSAEAQDWESLVEDIGALDRVIDYYGG
jgi:oligoribonuclease (3'-5' exoribonuclease)